MISSNAGDGRLGNRDTTQGTGSDPGPTNRRNPTRLCGTHPTHHTVPRGLSRPAVWTASSQALGDFIVPFFNLAAIRPSSGASGGQSEPTLCCTYRLVRGALCGDDDVVD